MTKTRFTRFHALGGFFGTAVVLVGLTGTLAHNTAASVAKAATPSAPAAVVYSGKTGHVTAGGSTTFHDWALKSTQIRGSATLIFPGVTGRPAPALVSLTVKIPVLSLKSSDTGMEHTAYKRLRHRKFPLITYVVTSAKLLKTSVTKPAVYTFSAWGKLIVAGKTRHMTLQITVAPAPGGQLTISTSTKLKMTDFGISPPTALLGIIQSSNTVSVQAVCHLTRRKGGKSIRGGTMPPTK